MNLREELESYAAKHLTCRLCKWLGSRPPEEQAEWNIHLADTSIKPPQFIKAFERRGFVIAEGAVRNHRRKHLPT